MLNSLLKITSRSKKRVGRGGGSGKGMHTVGRGSKGNKSRQGGSIPLWFEGGQLPLIKRLPYMRGKFHFKTLQNKPVIITFAKLAKLEGQDVTPETLVAAGLIKHESVRAKIIAGGVAPKVKEIRGVEISASAKTALEQV